MEDEKESTGTSIDMGDDLLEEASSLLPGLGSGSVVDLEKKLADIEDLVNSANILKAESLYEEAKAAYRKVLRQDPHNVTAKKSLIEIHEEELKQIFSSSSPISRKSSEKIVLETHEIVSKLEADLGFKEDLPIFLSERPESIEEYCRKVNSLLHDASWRDRLDLAIAYFEMGLYPVSSYVFDRTYELVDQHDDVSAEAAGSVLAMFGTSLLFEGKAFEALLHLEPALVERDLPIDQKLEIAYLCGRAHEKLGKKKKALQYYREVLSTSPDYRDIQMRLESLK